MIYASIFGATGYAGIELIRLLHGHPEVKIKYMVSQTHSGKQLKDIYPSFTGISEEICSDADIASVGSQSDVVFVSMPHGVSAETVRCLLDTGCRVIDLSGDFRYKSVSVYEEWYKVKHPYPELLKDSVYGLPELYRPKIREAGLVANPGCYTTCSILGLAPLVAERIIDTGSIVIDAKSGATGAGRSLSLNLHFCEVNENLKAYGVTNHRHTSEIEQELSILAGKDIFLSFTPHLIPVQRGILCTIYADLAADYTADRIRGAYCEYYGNEPFVDILSDNLLPELKYVAGSNRVQIGFAIDKRLNRLIIVSALDNLIKGAGGQAIQNMNIMFGFDETTALKQPAWYL